MRVVSFFAGCGGLDLGFEQAGFEVVWANDFDPAVKATYIRNHPATQFVVGDICKLDVNDIPDCDGFIGGPPCQSWSVAGRRKGLNDKRGQLFLTYIQMINKKKPKFFLIENVKGLLDEKFKDVFEGFLDKLSLAGYDVHWKMLDAADFIIPQNRERVFIIGIRKDLNMTYRFPKPCEENKVSLRHAIGDIIETPRFIYNRQQIDSLNPVRANHDVYAGSFGDYYVRGNRRRGWHQQSFTIHATGVNAPLHPDSPKMFYGGRCNWTFQTDRLAEYRRLSVRECARIQTFPDSFIFEHHNILSLYKMIGNAVPPRLGKALALSILSCLSGYKDKPVIEEDDEAAHDPSIIIGYYKNDRHLSLILKNRLYYVRADNRKGAMFNEDCPVAPDYILLYHKERSFMYELDREEPSLTDSSCLRRLGFDAKGERYLCFRLKDGMEKIFRNESGVIMKPYYNERNYAPYVSTVGQLMK